MPANETQNAMADRVRALLAHEPDLSEKAMFGTRAFLLDEKIVVAVFTDGRLLVRVDADDDLLPLEPDARPAFMGAKQREMGPGWLHVASDSLAEDDRLLFWVDAARDFRRGRG